MKPGSMYTNYFRLSEPPFSLTPDPRYLYMSERHREGLAHLLYGVQQSGGFIQLTGEIGCGKTTLCRCLVSQLPPETDIALILNPRLTVIELLAAFCDELRIPYPPGTDSIKVLIDVLNRHLLEAHAKGRRTVLVIDEAQNLNRDVLEQIRLLTNLETEQEKLLQIILIGQPELLAILKHQSLRQLAQRITARYHLLPLSRQETYAYIQHRLFIAGLSDPVFSKRAMRETYKLTGGVPRLINILCDRALLGAYALDKRRIGDSIIRRAGREIRATSSGRHRHRLVYTAGIAAFLILLGTIAILFAPWNISSLGRIIIGMTQQDDAVDSQNKESEPDRTAVNPKTTDPSIIATSTPGNPGSETSEGSDTGSTVSGFSSGRETETFTSVESQTGPATIESLSEVQFEDIIKHPSRSFSLTSSFNSLYASWGVPIRIKPSEIGCSAGHPYGFGCLFMTGNWLKLRRLDIPVILGIRLSDEQKGYVTLIGLNNNTATIAIEDRIYSFPIPEVDKIWDGSFILIWKPPFNTLNLPLGMQGEEIAWVRQTLNIYEGKSVPSSSTDLFDESLKQRILDFQKAQSLIPDGRIGPETLIRLTIAVDISKVPILSHYPHEREKS
jgi:general secretion pathway protein A